MAIASNACHTCRRKRLRCDRSLPKCRKCADRKQECMGYGKMFIWQEGVASRGKMAGVKPGDMGKALNPLPLRPMVPPNVQDMSQAVRGYLAYCKSSRNTLPCGEADTNTKASHQSGVQRFRALRRSAPQPLSQPRPFATRVPNTTPQRDRGVSTPPYQCLSAKSPRHQGVTHGKAAVTTSRALQVSIKPCSARQA